MTGFEIVKPTPMNPETIVAAGGALIRNNYLRIRTFINSAEKERDYYPINIHTCFTSFHWKGVNFLIERQKYLMVANLLRFFLLNNFLQTT